MLAKFVAVPLAWPLPMPLAGPWLWLLVVALHPLQLACPVLFHFFHICGAPCISAHGILNKGYSALWRHSSPLRSPADGCSTPLQVRPLLGMDAKPKTKHIYSSLCWKQKLSQSGLQGSSVNSVNSGKGQVGTLGAANFTGSANFTSSAKNQRNPMLKLTGPVVAISLEGLMEARQDSVAAF